MKLFTFPCVSNQAATPGKSGPRRLYRRRGLVRLITPLCVGSVLCAAMLTTNATTANCRATPRCGAISAKATAIYIYQDNIPVYEPDAYVQGGSVYLGAELVGTIEESNYDIIDPEGDVAGYVVY